MKNFLSIPDMKIAQHLWTIIFGACILAGGFSGYLWKASKGAPGESATDSSEQAPSISSDALSIQFFQHAISDKTGNIIVAPGILHDILKDLQSIAGGKTLDELNALPISPDRTPLVESFALLAADINLPRHERNQNILALPFSEDYPMTLSLFNSMLAGFTPHPNLQFATSDNTSDKTKLLGGATAYFIPDWKIPFHKANSQQADFDCASGRMPKFAQMRARGAYRTAKANDSSWQAAAIELQQAGGNSAPLFLVAILPAAPARSFAAGLTPDSLSAIRKALAEAEPADTLVLLPRMGQMVAPQDIRSTMSQFGLGSLFHEREADFSPFSKEPVHLGTLIYSCGLSLAESQSSAPADESLEGAANRMDFSRPFIWFVGELNTNSPMEFMGLVEEM